MTDDAANDDADKSRPRWRDDPLSLFLAVAAVLLAVMYAAEQRSIAELESRAAAAQSVAADLAPDDCVPGSAGASGEMLVLRCKRPAEVVVNDLGHEGWEPFKSVVIVGPTTALRCEVGREWPTACDALERSTESPEIADEPRPRPN